MTSPLSPVSFGIVLSVVGAVTWAIHYLFLRRGIDAGNVTNAVLVAMLCNLVLIVPIAVVRHHEDFGLTSTAVAVFTAAGLGSGLFGRLFQFESTDRVGASRTAPVVGSAGMISVLLAVVLLHETLTALHFTGIVLIVVGVMVTSWETARDPSEERSFRELGTSLVLPLGAAFLYGIEPVFIKVGLAEGTPYLAGMVVMIVSALVGFVGFRRWSGAASPRPISGDPGFKWYVGAGVAGTIAFVAYFWAFTLAPVVVVVPIFDTVPLLVVGLSVVFMPGHLERVTRRVVLAAGTVVVGAILVSVAA